ncbi:hypothetical protein CEXT_520801 [Caerostris extrusa]|uniref:Uncharacterized protein n=1 Tax=Caerostris extrusa TaxID=172846 RepID=A0AAV4NWC0_CAEEX|nr:hypothetical protein CEXT_520801 [Caerostris extrusa]
MDRIGIDYETPKQSITTGRSDSKSTNPLCLSPPQIHINKNRSKPSPKLDSAPSTPHPLPNIGSLMPTDDNERPEPYVINDCNSND